jgi:hypothetical protein
VTGAFEPYRLPAEVQERLAELRELSKRAEAGEKGARQELKQKLRESSPQVIARASDVGRKAQHLLISTAAAGEPLTELALSARLDMMREEIVGENPTPLEVLLTERVVSCWMLVTLFDVLMSAQLWKETPKEKRSPPSYLKHMIRWQESATRRYLAAIKGLVQVRKLIRPSVQINYARQQVNVAGDLKR